jgi:hypothetical protein
MKGLLLGSPRTHPDMVVGAAGRDAVAPARRRDLLLLLLAGRKSTGLLLAEQPLELMGRIRLRVGREDGLRVVPADLERLGAHGDGGGGGDVALGRWIVRTRCEVEWYLRPCSESLLGFCLSRVNLG